MKRLALSDSQMQTVRTAARSVPVAHRCDFLNHVADHLRDVEEVSDLAVLHAVQDALLRFAEPVL